MIKLTVTFLPRRFLLTSEIEYLNFYFPVLKSFSLVRGIILSQNTA